MKRFDSFARVRSTWLRHEDLDLSAVERGNRRRVLVFLSVFCTACGIGLAYDFLRPAEYRATSRLQITPASYAAPSVAPGAPAVTSPPDPERPFLTEVQKLSSRPLLEQVAKRLGDAGQDLSALGPDPAAALQSALTVTPVPGTHVVDMAATGPRPELPAGLLVAISDEYRKDLARSYEEHSGEAQARADDEVRKLEAAVAAKREAVEEYRLRYNIVSPEREENEALAQLQGLGKSLQAASDRVSAAQGKVTALREAAAAGKSVVRAKDNPTLANLEQRASKAREDLRNLERTYTADYIALDPNARALRASLTELERQIAVQREASQQAALAEAEEELASAREAEHRLRAQIAAGRGSAGQFAARFEQYKELQSELAQLQSAYQDALQRRAKLEATERARVPSVQILDQAVLPMEPWRPRYWRDAAFVLAGSLLLALVAMAIVELFNRTEPQPSVVLAQPVIDATLLQGAVRPHVLNARVHPALSATGQPALPAPAVLPRELSAEEIFSLLRAAEPLARRAILLIVSGLTPEEALALRWRDVDREHGVVHVDGAHARSVTLSAVVTRSLSAASELSDAPVLGNAAGEPAAEDALCTGLLNAAHDAGLERVYEVTPQALRHSYIAFLVRQGIRFADLAKLVGQLPSATLAAYSGLAPPGVRAALGSVKLVYPSLERLDTI